jgi:hypothetical protein
MKTWTVLGIFMGFLFASEAYGGSCIYQSDPSSGTVTVLVCGPPPAYAIYEGCDPNETPPVDTGCIYPAGCAGLGDVTLPESCGDEPTHYIRIKPVFTIAQ